VTETLLQVKGLSVALPTRSGYHKAVDDLSFAVDAGEIMGIAGESGSGKTMTALALFGLLPPGARVTGSIRLDGHELTALSGKQLRDVRGRQLAMVSQDPATALHPILPVGTQLTEHMRHHLRIDKAKARSRAAELLETVRIPDPERALRAYPGSSPAACGSASRSRWRWRPSPGCWWRTSRPPPWTSPCRRASCGCSTGCAASAGWR
jgi:ABC-type dipeptide/oligopeptide/nickel transport system ATPase component